MPDLNLYEATLAAFSEFADSQLQVLHALVFAQKHSASASELRTLLGLAAVVQVNRAIGQAGRKVFMRLRVHPDGLQEGAFQWWTVIAVGELAPERGFVWQLRPEVASALIACGLTEHGLRTADEVASSALLLEGGSRQVLVNAYERNPVARARCLHHYGLECAVCGVNFGKLYGKIAEGFIHVHHLVKMSSIHQEYEVDPIADLRPVCPNCHAVVHMAEPPYTLEQVREFLSHGCNDIRRKKDHPTDLVHAVFSVGSAALCDLQP